MDLVEYSVNLQDRASRMMLLALLCNCRLSSEYRDFIFNIESVNTFLASYFRHPSITVRAVSVACYLDLHPINTVLHPKVGTRSAAAPRAEQNLDEDTELMTPDEKSEDEFDAQLGQLWS